VRTSCCSWRLGAACPPYTWSIVGGQLPDGLQLIGGTGFIIGKPTAVGNSTVTLQVADSETTAATKTVTLTFKVVDGVQIAAVEFTQVIQQFQYLDDLENSLVEQQRAPGANHLLQASR
jgi:hypothetical protein